MIAHHRQPRGFILPAVLLFLIIAFGMWAILFRSSSSALRVDEARSHRDGRTSWSAPAIGAGLRLLETGTPPTDPYSCLVELSRDGVSKMYRLDFALVTTQRWTVSASAAAANDPSPDAPSTFATAPSTPGGLNGIGISPTQIDLSWNDVVTDDGYLIERSPDGSNSWSQIGTTATDVTTYSDTTVAADTTYYYRIRAYNEVGNGNYSNVVDVATPSDIPDAPTDFMMTVLGADSVQLTWNDVSSVETGFEIEKSNNGTGWQSVTTTAADLGTYDVNFNNAESYHYRIRALGPGGNSTWVQVDP